MELNVEIISGIAVGLKEKGLVVLIDDEEIVDIVFSHDYKLNGNKII